MEETSGQSCHFTLKVVIDLQSTHALSKNKQEHETLKVAGNCFFI